MKQRNSAIEMLRILSMMMVLMVHFVGATFGLPQENSCMRWILAFCGKTFLNHCR